MDSRSASKLESIERNFAFVGEKFGLSLVQSTDVPSFAWYRTGDRTVVVSYDPINDAAVDVHFELKSTDERHLLTELLAFEPIDAARHEGVVEAAKVEAEIERAASMLATYGAEFLSGDLDGFRTRFREALLVKTTRQLAMREFYEGDPRRAKTLYEALRAYWNDADREHFNRLASGGDKALSHLRLKT